VTFELDNSLGVDAGIRENLELSSRRSNLRER